jgi:hypothetical protein
MGIKTLVSDVVSSRYYRTNPLAAAQLVYAKWVFSRLRENDPVKFLEAKGIDTIAGFAGYDRWATTLESVIHNVGAAPGQQGGCSMEDGKILYAGVSTSFIWCGFDRKWPRNTLFDRTPTGRGNGARAHGWGSF